MVAIIDLGMGTTAATMVDILGATMAVDISRVKEIMAVDTRVKTLTVDIGVKTLTVDIRVKEIMAVDIRDSLV
jgi:hypothetical protein